MRLNFCFVLLLLAGCASNVARVEKPTPLLLVSIDGLRATDVATMPTLAALADHGVAAESMRPSYPSLTFPNHYTLVTGLRPDHHGIIHNSMQDPALGKFNLSLRDAVGDHRWWDGGEPVWIGAKKAGLRSATMFWPGSEAAIRGAHPDYWKPFDAKVTPQQRVEQVLAWLDLPAQQRPDLLTLYFDQVDHAGHQYGPDSAETRDARASIDQALSQLRAGLETRGLSGRINLIVVSDHGMATVEPGHALAAEDLWPDASLQIVSFGQVIGLAPRDGDEAAYAADALPALLGRHEHHQCWRKQDLPPRWGFGTHPRIPAVVCQMDEGWDALPREAVAKYANAGPRGSHGYDPALPSMQAVFVATGPAFRKGTHLPAFDNVDVYPLLARLLGFAPAPNDGDITPLLPALRDSDAQ